MSKCEFKTKIVQRKTFLVCVKSIKHSQVILVVDDGIMASNITIPGAFYQVRYVDNGVHAIYEINQSAFPEEAPPIPVE